MIILYFQWGFLSYDSVTKNSDNLLEEEIMSMPYPRTFSHIGISVPDLEVAVKSYTQST